MQLAVAVGVVDGEEDEPDGADNGEEDGEGDEDLLGRGAVGQETPSVTQPALGGEGEVEGDGGDAGASYEERLHLEGANVADVGQAHVGVEGGQAAAVDGDDPPEQHAQEHAQPDEAGEDGDPLEGLFVSWRPS